MNNKIETLYREICKIYFPRWKPWDFTYNPKWCKSGYCNNHQKHIYFGEDSPVLVIHEICHAVGDPGHGKKWQTRVLKAAETAKRYDRKLSKELIAEVEKYQIDNWGHKTEIKFLYQTIEDTFAELYSKNKSVNVFYVLKYLLYENGIRKEWDEKLFEKMLKRGRKIAEFQSKLSRR